MPWEEKSESVKKVLRVMARHDPTTPDKVCAWCGGKAGPFRDKLSRKEYGISGLCQECQDKVFGE